MGGILLAHGRVVCMKWLEDCNCSIFLHRSMLVNYVVVNWLDFYQLSSLFRAFIFFADENK
jgi:hypothetical protein